MINLKKLEVLEILKKVIFRYDEYSVRKSPNSIKIIVQDKYGDLCHFELTQDELNKIEEWLEGELDE